MSRTKAFPLQLAHDLPVRSAPMSRDTSSTKAVGVSERRLPRLLGGRVPQIPADPPEPVFSSRVSVNVSIRSRRWLTRNQITTSPGLLMLTNRAFTFLNVICSRSPGNLPFIGTQRTRVSISPRHAPVTELRMASNAMASQ